MDINNKQACPRCHGSGFIHMDDELKHDKAKNVKCKNCKNCSVCNGTGTIVNKVACTTCNVKGWIHDSNHPHDASEKMRCFYCRNCPDCKGAGVRKLETVKKASSQYGFDKGQIHPKYQSMSSAKSQLQSQIAESKPLQEEHLRGSCPVCGALGFVHESYIAHDKPSGKPCKYCSVCRACAGAGIVVGKQACTQCNAKGWYHPANSTKLHNVTPSTMRCFYCKDCSACNGYGVIDPTKSKEIYRNSILSQKPDPSQYSSQSKEPIAVQVQPPPNHKNYQPSPQYIQKLLEKEQEKQQQEQMIAKEYIQQKYEENQKKQQMEIQFAQQQKLQQQQQMQQIQQMQQMQQLQQMQQIQQMQQMQMYQQVQYQQPMMYCATMPYGYATTTALTPVIPYTYSAAPTAVPGATPTNITPCPTCQGLGFRHKKKSSKPHSSPYPNIRCENCRDCKNCHGTGYVNTV